VFTDRHPQGLGWLPRQSDWPPSGNNVLDCSDGGVGYDWSSGRVYSLRCACHYLKLFRMSHLRTVVQILYKFTPYNPSYLHLSLFFQPRNLSSSSEREHLPTIHTDGSNMCAINYELSSSSTATAYEIVVMANRSRLVALTFIFRLSLH